MTNTLRILSGSDFHFGHPKLNAVDTAVNLSNTLINNLHRSDILILAGDIYDRLLTLTADANIIISIILDILKYANKHNVLVRILRGTWTHDRDQCELFVNLHDKYEFTNSLKYFDTISLEYIDKYKLRILYIPDNLPYKSSEECMDVVNKMLADMQWDTVDYVVMHGTFEHVLPVGMPHKPKCTFRAEQFEKIVKKKVLAGHIHPPSIYKDLIIYHGSHERLAHGEQHPKGLIYIKDTGNKCIVEFIENKNALIFDTIPIGTEEDAISVFLDKLRGYDHDKITHIRIACDDPVVRSTIYKLVSVQYPKVVLTHITSKDNNVKSLSNTDLITLKHTEPPTEETLPQLVKEFIDLNFNDKLELNDIVYILNK